MAGRRFQLLGQLAGQRELLMSLVKRDLKVRYKDSVLGFFWSLCKPLFLMLILSVVFSFIVRIPIGGDIPYPLFLLTGLLPWMFFAGSVHDATHSLLANAPLIKKVSLNAAVFPVACVMGNLVHLVLAYVVYLLFLAYYGVGLGWNVWLVIPAAALQTALCIALALLTSALNVFYRDVSSIVELLITCWFYVTPVLYPASLAFGEIETHFPERADWMRPLYMLNPMAPVVALYRRAFLYGGETLEMSDAALAGWTLAAAATTTLLALLGWRVFRDRRMRFADQL